MIHGLIYIFRNIKNNKFYVGQTTEDFKLRLQKHKYHGTSEKSQKKDRKFYQAIRKHGWQNFEWFIIDTCYAGQVELDTLEIHYIDYFNSYNKGYNATKGGSYVPQNKNKTLNKLSKNEIFNIFSKRKDPRVGRKDPADVIKNKCAAQQLVYKQSRGGFQKPGVRERSAEKRRNNNPVICWETGLIYGCAKIAAVTIGINHRNMSPHLKGESRFSHIGGYTFSKIDKTNVPMIIPLPQDILSKLIKERTKRSAKKK